MESTKEVNSLMEKVGEGVSELGKKVSSYVPPEYGGEKVKKTFETTGDYIKDTQLNDMYSHMCSTVRKSPLLSIGIALGVGLFLGKALRPSR
jgi:ElaB/YqjD/DUF883 family membrane-anchored ribosome-binding protein